MPTPFSLHIFGDWYLRIFFFFGAFEATCLYSVNCLSVHRIVHLFNLNLKHMKIVFKEVKLNLIVSVWLETSAWVNCELLQNNACYITDAFLYVIIELLKGKTPINSRCGFMNMFTSENHLLSSPSGTSAQQAACSTGQRSLGLSFMKA